MLLVLIKILSKFQSTRFFNLTENSEDKCQAFLCYQIEQSLAIFLQERNTDPSIAGLSVIWLYIQNFYPLQLWVKLQDRLGTLILGSNQSERKKTLTSKPWKRQQETIPILFKNFIIIELIPAPLVSSHDHYTLLILLK